MPQPWISLVHKWVINPVKMLTIITHFKSLASRKPSQWIFLSYASQNLTRFATITKSGQGAFVCLKLTEEDISVFVLIGMQRWTKARTQFHLYINNSCTISSLWFRWNPSYHKRSKGFVDGSYVPSITHPQLNYSIFSSFFHFASAKLAKLKGKIN